MKISLNEYGRIYSKGYAAGKRAGLKVEKIEPLTLSTAKVLESAVDEYLYPKEYIVDSTRMLASYPSSKSFPQKVLTFLRNGLSL